MSDRPQHFSGEVWCIHEFGPPEVMMLEHITTSTPAARRSGLQRRSSR